MNCQKAQKYIPDFSSGDLPARRREALKQHLRECLSCRQWKKSWSQIQEFSREVIKPSQELDWSPFDLALDEEFKLNSVPGSRRSGLLDSLKLAKGNIWYFRRILKPRWVLVGTTAIILILIGNHLKPIQDIKESHLIIGHYLTSEQQSSVILYQEGETNNTYYSETINLELIEGRDEYSF